MIFLKYDSKLFGLATGSLKWMKFLINQGTLELRKTGKQRRGSLSMECDFLNCTTPLWVSEQL